LSIIIISTIIIIILIRARGTEHTNNIKRATSNNKNQNNKFSRQAIIHTKQNLAFPQSQKD